VAAPHTRADATRWALEELAWDDIERDAFAGELDAVRVARTSALDQEPRR